jgi:hypothetical protein
VTPTIPPTIHQLLTQPESVDAAVDAMKLFIAEGDPEAFQHAIAIYCAGACERGDECHLVLGALCRLAADLEGLPDEGVFLKPSAMHSLIFTGILRAFYGDRAVDLGAGARAQRKADAPQHVHNGTWPKPPAIEATTSPC